MSDVVDQKGKLGAAARAFVSAPAKMLIDGKWVESESGQTIDVVDPATGLLITTAQAGTAKDVDRAVAAARRAFDGDWSAARPVNR